MPIPTIARVRSELTGMSTAATSGLMCPATASPTATQQATVSEFAGKVGQSFDETYRAQAMSNHEQAILVFAEAAKAAKDPDVRNFAERSLGDMKERHASMGGEAVKLKGEIALKLQKTTKTPAAATATAAAPCASAEGAARSRSERARRGPTCG